MLHLFICCEDKASQPCTFNKFIKLGYLLIARSSFAIQNAVLIAAVTAVSAAAISTAFFVAFKIKNNIKLKILIT